MTTRPDEKDLNRVINFLWDLTLDEGRWVRGGGVTHISPYHVLIEPFSRDRLDDCLALARKRQPPPIDCQRIDVGPWTFYTVNDGQHRTLAARRLGKQSIPAMVGASIVVDTTVFVVHRDSVWRKLPDKPGTLSLVVWKKDLTDTQWAALLWLIEQGKKPKPVRVPALLPLDGNLTAFAICARCGKPLFGDVAYNATDEGGHAGCLVGDGHFEVLVELTGVKPWTP